MLKCFIKRSAFLLLLLWGFSISAGAVTVQDQRGTFSIDYVPKRIVVLEFSFADALAAVHVSPVGIADDKDAERLLPAIRAQFSGWASVGTRSQPSLEVIASLKPDLIIADVERHAAVYDDLVKIAPTLMLQSRRETYEDNLASAAIIGTVVGKGAEMQARLQLHEQRMVEFRNKLSALRGKTLQFGVARENGFFVHANESYAGGVAHTLGFTSPPALQNDRASRQVGLEQMLALNPDYLVIGDYTPNSIIHRWEKQPLWQMLNAVRAHHVVYVSGNLWSRCRGILAAEYMAQDLIRQVQS
ncbi:Fe(3+) dicitrate ABC transporter substrate-binding protein [Vibrio mangrovi]|uniref:Fe(3+) dicitrate ABC transporter substrate-binding protein n=1 Tax=Vibrio mangrovi TaxID=474394 RepID=A0A1Y6IVK0_9VIBR|nr:Fe(3+) dicitrate ABC transporter substrate-binding protein [Vibrio mangrovi]MDW6004943.1 Fe(3+) dicitrate ABC transporter substrate-binding protein [Vibrio mangrovi]SMS01705.1 Fe(3+)-citrate-binding protein YfmC precursor [Vibrio mangrovi]